MFIGKHKSNVPSQVLDDIFKHVEREFRRFRFSPERPLYPLLLVCKDWHGVAERRLYASVSLGDAYEFGNKRISAQALCRKFLRTLRRNPRLISLVRELRMGSMFHERAETEQYVALLILCTNVKHVELAGYNGHVLGGVKAALIANADLVSLTVSRRGLADWEGDSFCSLRKLFKYMLRWPNLEKIYIDCCLPTYNTSEVPPNLSSVTRRCPHLKEFTIYGDTLPPLFLKLLSELAPGIQRLTIKIDSTTIPTLLLCIQAWSQSLIHLHLNSEEKAENSLASVCPSLGGLRSLRVESTVIPPAALGHFTKLESLQYYVTPTAAEELVHVIRRKGSLLALCKVEVTPRYYMGDNRLSPELIQQLRDACDARNITSNLPRAEHSVSQRMTLRNIQAATIPQQM